MRPRAVLATTVVLGAGAWLVAGLMPALRMFYDLQTAPAPSRLAVPVQGVAASKLADSWEAPRSAGRRHQGIDIFARRGTPVLSPVAGMVLGRGQDRLGGNVVRVLGPGGQVHYFAHLDAFGPFARWDFVRPGDVIGYVGDTGNAKGASPHLHYGIYARGGAVNPFPLLAGNAKRVSP